MDVKTFAALLAKELAKREIPKELAVRHAVSLVRTFDEEDLREISSYTSPEEFSELADSLAGLIRDKEQLKRRSAERRSASSDLSSPAENAATATFKSVSEKGEEKQKANVSAKDTCVSESMKTKAYKLESGELNGSTQTFAGIKTSDISLQSGVSEITEVNIPAVKSAYSDTEEQEIYLDEEDDGERVVLTKRGRAFFWGIAVITSPVTLLITLAVLGVFALGIVAVCALVVASLLLVLGEAVVGSGLTLVGVIYGAVEIVSGNVGIGIYEIGLGICCGAVFLALGILTYNFSVLVLPYILRQLISFEGYCLKRVAPMINRFREECNRL